MIYYTLRHAFEPRYWDGIRWVNGEWLGLPFEERERAEQFALTVAEAIVHTVDPTATDDGHKQLLGQSGNRINDGVLRRAEL